MLMVTCWAHLSTRNLMVFLSLSKFLVFAEDHYLCFDERSVAFLRAGFNFCFNHYLCVSLKNSVKWLLYTSVSSALGVWYAYFRRKHAYEVTYETWAFCARPQNNPTLFYILVSRLSMKICLVSFLRETSSLNQS